MKVSSIERFLGTREIVVLALVMAASSRPEIDGIHLRGVANWTDEEDGVDG